MNHFYVYAHCKIGSGIPFYIGKGFANRAYSKCGRNQFWRNVVKKHGYRIDIIFENLSEEVAILFEKYYIEMYGRRDLGSGPLVNMTEGGEGASGRSVSPETREKISKAQMGEKNHLFGKHHTEEAKGKISNSNLGKTLSKDHKEKLIKFHIGKKRSEETKQKISKSKSGENHPLFGKFHSEKTKEKMSKAASGENNHNFGKTASEETRRKLSEVHSGEKHPFFGKTHSKESKEKMSKTHTGRVVSEETKKKISETLKFRLALKRVENGN